jgi:hypothetical protein
MFTFLRKDTSLPFRIREPAKPVIEYSMAANIFVELNNAEY